jgi:hypothetical protein
MIITMDWAWGLYSSEGEYSSFGLCLRKLCLLCVYCCIMHKYYTTLHDIMSKRLEESYYIYWAPNEGVQT